ncbi:alpha/beta fold hydrolase [Alteraurantiacibacter aquimixticola]|uniref:Alpha/beta fold hydrolase n=1 Tax=Alteraurantiacibacter aquimixticola TaxID=2489173 RepID=A0A4T3F153_9SPHN|nr:alpha/beta fold hydrolase [Alteraurantiacibacter aquimixticola]TIX50287.1 alpha/beta fold hydrolase [Alteraurantiacibacter aquimixticola]
MNTQTIASFDGTPIAVHRMGTGRPVLLLHGLFSSAHMNWIKFGHAQRLADAGFEAIMPDHRAHGDSGKPHEASAYPPDVLVRDVKAVIAALELDDFDLVGFSMGGRTAAASVIAGVRPRRLVLAGMGLESLDNWQARAAFFIDAIDRFDEVKRGDRAFMAVSFMKTMNVDRVAARHLLLALDEIAREDVARITMPTLVLCGEDDRDNGSPHALAEALPDARLQLVPGTHMSSVTEAAMGEAIVNFLSD